MAGSWEILQNNQVLVGILHTDMTTIAWAMGLRRLIVPGQISLLSGMPYDMARNVACQQALDNGCRWLFFLDSVPSYTPILIKRQDDLIRCIPICDLAKFTGEGKEYVRFAEGDVKVFVGEKNGTWADVRHVLRHPFKGDLYRINTHSGVVDVSANHSVMRGGGPQRSIAGKDVRVGMQLSMPRDRGRFGRTKGKFFFGTQELAWFYGIFAAEGCASHGGIHIDNNDVRMLERCQKVLRTFFGKDLKIHRGSWNGRDVETKRVGTCGRRIYDFFRSKFYNSLGEKVVPVEILNAPEVIKRAFLDGYYEGDGHEKGGKWQSFSTNSHSLALGIQWLLQTVTGQTYAVHIRSDKLNIVGLSVNQEVNSPGQRKRRGLVKKVETVPYEGFLYDIETDKHVFAGGVGPVLLHNSDVIAPPDAILRLMAHNRPIVSGLYCRRSPPHAIPVMIRDGQWVTSFTPGSLVEVDYVGAGCLLIHREVLEKLPPSRPECGKRWFDWKVDMAGIGPPGENLSEDFVMCKNARDKLGIRTVVDTSVVCQHIGLGTATFQSFVPTHAH